MFKFFEENELSQTIYRIYKNYISRNILTSAKQLTLLRVHNIGKGHEAMMSTLLPNVLHSERCIHK